MTENKALVKALRDEANEAPAISSVGYSLMRKAADVIEEQQKDAYARRNALDSVTWYNGLAPVVFSWLKLESNGYFIGCPDNYGAPEGWQKEDVSQLEIFWMIAVEQFGSCGTSPRFGWIEDKEGFRRWILDITQLWRSSEDYDGPEEYRIDEERTYYG